MLALVGQQEGGQMQQSYGEVDGQMVHALDRAGVVGGLFRERLLKEFKAKIVLRSARDAVEVIGAPGTGKHTVAEAAHAVACDVLGRSGELHAFDCGRPTDMPLDAALAEAIDNAKGGTLLLDRFSSLDALARQAATRAIRRSSGEAFIVAVSADEPGEARTAATATSIRLKPLHERDEDVWDLVDHFFQATIEDIDANGCLGFSRQTKGDIAQIVQDTNLASVRRLRDIVRDLVFENLAIGPLPLKLTTDHVRPYLERSFGQTEAQRVQRDGELMASQFDAVVERSMLEQLAGTHEVPEELLIRQAQLLSEMVGKIGDVPKSYRNIMTKAEDIHRAALWLMTGATTQAEFRRHFGDEGFMRPTKSVAWAFYNRVFKRDM